LVTLDADRPPEQALVPLLEQNAAARCQRRRAGHAQLTAAAEAAGVFAAPLNLFYI
jgi:hypothetical protein